MESQKTKDCKFVKQFWEWIFIICNQKMVRYWQRNKEWIFTRKSNKVFNNANRPIEWNLCDHSDAYFSYRRYNTYISVTADVTVTGGNTNTKIVIVHSLKNIW